MLTSITLLLYLLHSIQASTIKSGDDNVDDYEYDDSYDYPYSEEEDLTKKIHIPEINMNPKTYVFEEGKTIRIPCIVDKLQVEYVQLLWNKLDGKNTLIAMGKEIKNADFKSRSVVEVDEKGSTLILESAKETDSGQYKCTVGHEKQQQVIHTLSVLKAPDIVSMKDTKREIINAKVGDDVKLTCEASGTPTPKLTWRKENDTDFKKVQGFQLIIQSVSMKDSGIYSCNADNGQSAPVTREIEVRVKMESESDYVNDEGHKIVHDNDLPGDHPISDHIVASGSGNHIIFTPILFITLLHVPI